MMKKHEITIDGSDGKRMIDMIKGINLSHVKILHVVDFDVFSIHSIWKKLSFDNIRVVSFLRCSSYVHCITH